MCASCTTCHSGNRHTAVRLCEAAVLVAAVVTNSNTAGEGAQFSVCLDCAVGYLSYGVSLCEIVLSQG
jgi:hypothetical protein